MKSAMLIRASEINPIMKKSSRAVPVLKAIGYLALFIVLGYIGYSVWFYTQNTESVEEFEICYEDRCIKTYHVHYTLLVDICGRRTHLPPETGPLDGIHTHKEANYLHFHERIEYDPKTGELFDSTPFIVKTTMGVFGIRLNQNCLGDYCTGDPCPDGKPGAVTMLVNNQKSTAFENYKWNDEDVVQLSFQ